MDLLLDADATIAMRGLGLLESVLSTSVGVAFTGYIYNHELSSLVRELEPHRQSGRILVHGVLARTPAFKQRRQLTDRGLDKGEAEAIAWLLDDSARAEAIAFVTLDRRARETATENHLTVLNVAETAAALVATSVLDQEVVRAHLSVWDDRRNQSGRPRDWKSFESDFPALVATAQSRWVAADD